ncbi:response regulator [Roseicyclus persicicus]|uniref:Response regulator n=1 Tax=Roseicyclus persicicus TaxID=2650661 RepID=A0A7X6GWP6_9RHOB|nr:response regulator [Roseibacterium persicicum]NKX43764.1 response regulator [Roseibacterium persicicum]
MTELRTILHVDDDRDILEIARMALELVDRFELHQFNNGSDAIAAAPGLRPDLILLDVMMPDMTGPEVWAALRDIPALRDVPVIFMTAQAENSTTDDLVGQGALAVITKPFDPMTLGAEIRAAYARATGPGVGQSNRNPAKFPTMLQTI